MQEKPSSAQGSPAAASWQDELQQSPSATLPSSQPSPDSRVPFPQTGTVVVVVVVGGASIWQEAEQPSLSVRFPSSQDSPDSRIPSPQVAAHACGVKTASPRTNSPAVNLDPFTSPKEETSKPRLALSTTTPTHMGVEEPGLRPTGPYRGCRRELRKIDSPK